MAMANQPKACLSLRKQASTSQNAKKLGFDLEVTSAYRSYEQQQILWEKYNHDTTKVSEPSCINSPHVKGYAVDVVFVDVNGNLGMNTNVEKLRFVFNIPKTYKTEQPVL
jgi:D-alanyl-D-alanine dipeptidase